MWQCGFRFRQRRPASVQGGANASPGIGANSYQAGLNPGEYRWRLRFRHEALELGDRVHEYVDKKVGRMERFLPGVGRARVELSHAVLHSAGEVHTTQITAWVDRRVLRAEESSPDLFTSIDLASDKMLRQIERHKGQNSRSTAPRAARFGGIRGRSSR